MRLEPLIATLREASGPTLHVHPDPGRIRALAMLAGSFDPLTVGHETLAASGAARAGTVALVLSIRTLPKEGQSPPPLWSTQERLRILERFCAARPGHLAGIASHGLLLEQAVAAAARFPEAELFLVMGSDKALQLLDPRWYRDRDAALNRLFGLARVLYAERAGQEGEVARALAEQRNRTWRERFERLDVAPEIASVSSRRVRELLGEGLNVERLVPPEAWEALRSGGPPE